MQFVDVISIIILDKQLAYPEYVPHRFGRCNLGSIIKAI
jgi:hypothetical protein